MTVVLIICTSGVSLSSPSIYLIWLFITWVVEDLPYYRSLENALKLKYIPAPYVYGHTQDGLCSVPSLVINFPATEINEREVNRRELGQGIIIIQGTGIWHDNIIRALWFNIISYC